MEPEHIRWEFDSEAPDSGFDPAYHCDWSTPDQRCRRCGSYHADFQGHPCRALAEHIEYWIPRAQKGTP